VGPEEERAPGDGGGLAGPAEEAQVVDGLHRGEGGEVEAPAGGLRVPAGEGAPVLVVGLEGGRAAAALTERFEEARPSVALETGGEVAVEGIRHVRIVAPSAPARARRVEGRG